MGRTNSILAWIHVSLLIAFVPLSSNSYRSATTISAVKLYEIKALSLSKDVAYESINLSILSVTEVCVGSLTTSLPPLRRLFENWLNRILPESMCTRPRTNAHSYALPDYASNLDTRQGKQGDHVSDDSSEKTILPDAGSFDAHTAQSKSGEIKKTTHVSLTVGDAKPASENDDWA